MTQSKTQAPTVEQLREAFTKVEGGPNPYYQCTQCGQIEPQVREYLETHWLSHNAPQGHTQ